ncbi:class I SAM-dependent methyltransferase [Xenorhabdus bovienii]|uniref:class I SAM-dependent methyltransferase n=1 Tax=Xenorhabdus bovienii TaxID=40576 RepID=UPI00237CC913|nr:class I SAM-dependent methyltransferase [Xenorhabdus bovienii]MDE1482208.1 class I SAM-dependent methyltransferase [Xenorhabdus bovienii]MDE9432895.1 class I SAM-dependent methyltransferase [Xenorhabdus bovienii]MDE9457409.1 class I SAM-dependent methyltransferase [Xenorhabdus bovienii]MDE9485593.1 class I SAM-dependent methyltransferase [Xenorhabdus bovienii]MDE9490671.1 class I SAM-dependent methyltransferase [Xenorhabdus bovienii]
MSSDTKPHYIDAQRTIVPVDVPSTAPRDYEEVLRSDFVSSYNEGRDAWTEEAAMQQASAILHAHLGRSSDVLDAGAGRGRDTGFLLAQGHRVTAVDLVELPEWAQLVRNWGSQVQFRITPVTELDGENLFDGVLDNGCLHHQHPDAYVVYLRRIHELLRPAGLFTISVFESKEPGRLYANKMRRLYREFTDSELTELLRVVHFTLVSVHRVPRPTAGLNYLVLTVRKSCSY